MSDFVNWRLVLLLVGALVVVTTLILDPTIANGIGSR